MALTPRAYGIPWYRPEDYKRILKLMTDRHLLPPTFLEWEKKALQVEAEFLRQGAIAERVYIDPQSFRFWARQRGLDINAAARNAFAAEAVARKYGGVH